MITRYSDWYHFRGTAEIAAEQRTRGTTIGKGLEAFVLACVEGFSRGHDVGFVRPESKRHGLQLLEEGAHRRESRACDDHRGEPVIEVPAATIPRAEDALFNVGSPDRRKSRRYPVARMDRLSEIMETVQRHIYIESGTFMLSSGSVSKRYVDTVPAVTAFDSVRSVMQIASLLYEATPSLIVAPPFGGVSLGIMAGMQWGSDVAIPADNTVAAKGLVEVLNSLPSDERVLIMDDYHSTGSTIARVLRGLQRPAAIFSICRSEGHIDTASASATENGQNSIKSLFINRAGALSWSDDVIALAGVGQTG